MRWVSFLVIWTWVLGRADAGTEPILTWPSSDKKGKILSFPEETPVSLTVSDVSSLREGLSLEAWVYPAKVPDGETGIAGCSFDTYAFTIYGDRHFYWYIGSGGNKCKTPAKATYWHHLVGTFDGETLKLFQNGELADSAPSQFSKIPRLGGSLFVGKILRSLGTGPDTLKFLGAVGTVRLYDRPLTSKEIRRIYRKEKRLYKRMEAGLEQISLTAYLYPERKEVYADVCFGNFYPLGEGEKALLSFWRMDDKRCLAEGKVPPPKKSDTVRDVLLRVPTEKELKGGSYEVRVSLSKEGKILSGAAFSVKHRSRPMLPSPKDHVIPPLPDTGPPPALELYVGKEGGFTLTVGESVIPVVSTFSYPHGGENALLPGHEGRRGQEPGWRVTSQEENGIVRVQASGAFYCLERKIEPGEGRVLVRDTLRNLTQEPLGILLSNGIELKGLEGVSCVQHPIPALFLHREELGVGLVALDDVYREHHETFLEEELAGIRDHRFALEGGAQYTLEWSVYLSESSDFYDFLNAVRRDEGLLQQVEGSFAFMDRREPASEEFVQLRNLKYASVPCLGHAADDPGLGLEGIEFTEYAQESRLLREQFAQTLDANPDLKVMFHVAHSLYATNEPDALFPDSRTLNASGKQTDYGNDNKAYYLKYFSPERVEEGYRWFIFYPALDNAFGQAMLEATDFMLEEIRVSGMFADGLTHGYGGRFTYDRWDGHTAEIDPDTKTIRRTYASVNLLADPVLVQVVRKITSKAGVVIANSHAGTRTFNREDVIWCIETGGGDQSCSRLYLSPTVIGLGNPGQIECERDVYDDIRGKLEWGALYFYYGEGEITRPTVTADMFPITVEEIHRGWVKGKERLVTMRSGVYGWKGDDRLHFPVLYDGRGVQVPHRFLTAASPEGTRTAIELGENETAVLKRIPAKIRSATPVHLIASKYDEQGLDLLAWAQSSATLTLKNGPLAIQEGASYKATLNGQTSSVTPTNGSLTLTLPPRRPIELSVR